MLTPHYLLPRALALQRSSVNAQNIAHFKYVVCSTTLLALAEIENQRGSSCPFLCREDIFLHFYPEKKRIFQNLGCTAYLKYARIPRSSCVPNAFHRARNMKLTTGINTSHY